MTAHTFDVPSPSATIACARSAQAASNPAWKAPRFGGAGAVPVASSTTVSLVDPHASMLMRLKVRSTACCRARLSTVPRSGASVTSTVSMVAMAGSIMPAPLAIPPMRHRPAVVGDLDGEQLGTGVGGGDRPRRALPRCGVVRQVAEHRGEPGDQPVDRQGDPDDAGRQRQHVGGVAAEHPRCLGAGAPGVVEPTLTGAGVGRCRR